MIIKGKYEASSPLLRQGIEVDLVNRKFKRIQKALGFFRLKNDWQLLPRLNYVLLFQTFYSKCVACDLNDKDKSGTLQVSLVYNKNRKIIIHEGKNEEEVKTIAKQLASSFGLRIKDAMTDRRAPLWI